MGGYFLSLNSVPLICVYIFLLVSYCFGYYSFVVLSEIKICDASGFVPFSQNLFWLSRVICVSIQISILVFLFV